MKICRSPQCKGATFDDSVDQCPNCTGKLEPLPVAEGVILPPAKTPIPPGAELQCPKCGAEMIKGTPFCERGCQISGAPPNQGELLNCRMNTGPAIPKDAEPSLWLEYNGETAECKNGDVLGYEGSVRPDLFHNRKISDNHCAVFCNEGQWTMLRLFTGRNPTYLDGRPIEKGQSMPLMMGIHLLQISSQFSIRLLVQKKQ